MIRSQVSVENFQAQKYKTSYAFSIFKGKMFIDMNDDYKDS